MDSESSSFVKEVTKDSSPALFNAEQNKVLDEDDPYSFIGTSNALLGLCIAIASIAIPVFAVLIEKPTFSEETSPISLEPYGSKYTRPISFTRISQHSC